jgi:hypothetical protein
MKNFDEFKQAWLEETANIEPTKELSHLVFVVHYPDDLKWSHAVEKQTQMTVVQTSGGITGSGTGHIQKLCYTSEVDAVLRECKDQSHAMIVSIGMIFDMTANNSTIQRFYEFSESNEYMKCHIIAQDSSAHINGQHLEINLDMWRAFGCAIWEVWQNFKRSQQNFHGDYTPHWLKPHDRPLINNFNDSERHAKAWSYPHLRRKKLLQNKNWKNIKGLSEGWIESVNVDTIDNYTKILMKRMRPRFYSENTELIGDLPQQKFDLIFTPTAGYSGEIFADRLDFSGEVVFYDNCKENLEIKQNIVEMFMSIDDIKRYSKLSKHPIVFNNHGFLQNHYPDYDKDKFSQEYGDRDSLKLLQYKMYNKHEIDYWQMDIIKTTRAKGRSVVYKKLIDKIKGKDVFFDVSNIFGYHVSHAGYTLDELVQALDQFKQILQANTNSFYIKGTRPGKQEMTQ